MKFALGVNFHFFVVELYVILPFVADTLFSLTVSASPFGAFPLTISGSVTPFNRSARSNSNGVSSVAVLSVVVKLPEPSLVLNLIALLPVGTTGVSLNALISIVSFSVMVAGSAGVAFLVPLSVTVNSKSDVPDALAVALNFKPCN